MTTFSQRAVEEINWIADWGKIQVELVPERRKARSYPGERRIETPFPRLPGDFAAFLHEAVHVIDGHKHVGMDPAKVEVVVSKRAMEIYREFGFPGADEAAYSLGRFLNPHLEDAIERGAITTEWVRDEVPGELLAYPHRFGIQAGSNGHTSLEDELRAFQSGPMP